MGKRREVGKDQLNTERDNVNRRTDRLHRLGSSKTASWRRRRRFRSF